MHKFKKEKVRELLRIIKRFTNWEAPNGLLQGIAEEVGCSREYVRQEAVKMHFQMKRAKIKKPNKICAYCGKKFVASRISEKYCSIKCRDLKSFYTNHTLDTCKECGFGFINPVSRGLKHKAFCTKQCFGRHLGKTWGHGRTKRIKYAQVKTNDDT